MKRLSEEKEYQVLWKHYLKHGMLPLPWLEHNVRFGGPRLTWRNLIRKHWLCSLVWLRFKFFGF